MNEDKTKVFLWIIVALLFVSTFLALSPHGWASTSPPYRPQWWSHADARISFDDLTFGNLGWGIAEGTKGYEYGWIILTFYDPDTSDEDAGKTDYLTVWLDNDENQSMTKKFWLALHLTEALDKDLPDSDPIFITGYYGDGSYNTLILDEDDAQWTSGENWVYFESLMFPQPDRETFVIQTLGNYLNSDRTDFSIDYVEIATYCVPVPPTLVLLGSGLVGLLGIRRRPSTS